MSDSTRVKADLIPYTSEYASVVRSWIECEETYKAVCRGVNFPPPDDIVDSWQRKGVRSFILLSENKPVAYGELWERRVEQAVEIAHLIVDRFQRSEGYGTKVLELLFARASTRPGCTRVLINLYSDSPEALGCYLKAGFELIGTATHVEGLKMMRVAQKY